MARFEQKVTKISMRDVKAQGEFLTENFGKDGFRVTYACPHGQDVVVFLEREAEEPKPKKAAKRGRPKKKEEEKSEVEKVVEEVKAEKVKEYLESEDVQVAEEE